MLDDLSKADLGVEAAPDSQVLLPPNLDPVDISWSGAVHSFGGQAFGTNYQAQLVRKGSADPALDGAWLSRIKQMCEELLDMVDRQMSPWRPESDLCRYNDLGDGETMLLPEPMRTIVRHGLDLHAMTGGVFDIGIYSATSLWGFGAESVSEALPDDGLKQALHAQRDRAALPSLDGVVLSKQAGFTLDLCGIAKGYAVDLLLSALRNDPETSAALVEIGGEFKGYGSKPDGMPWWVELSSDVGVNGDADGDEVGDSDFETRTLVGLHEWACASSGGANRSFTHDGRQYSHAIDPKTFEPVETDIISAHVLDRNCWRADALATALFAMGGARAIGFAEQHDIACLLLVTGENGAEEMASSSLSEWREDG